MRLLEASHAFEVSDSSNLIVSGKWDLTGPVGPGTPSQPALRSGPPAVPSPTGKVYQWEDPDSKLFDHPADLNAPESAPASRLTQTEVYKEFRLRGYDYGPHFQGIFEASLKGGQEHPRV